MNCLTPLEIARATCGAARAKSEWTVPQMLLLGALAGCYIGFGGFLNTVVTQDLAKYVGVGLSRLAGGVSFSLGLLLVVVAGAELFTGNCLMPLGVPAGSATLRGVLRNWFWVYLGNLLGSLLFAALLFRTGLLTGPVGANALRIAAAKMNLSAEQVFLRGVFCNWLVVLAVWMATSAQDVGGKALAVLFPVTAFVASGFEHCVANMYFLAEGLFLRGDPELVLRAALSPEQLARMTWAGYWGNIVPATLGNVVGAVLFVVAAYYRVYGRRLGTE